MPRHLPALFPFLAGALAMTTLPSGAAPPRSALAVANRNDNREAAGDLRDGRLDVALRIAPAAWHLLGTDQPPGQVLAFSEGTGSPSIPGPLLRVPLGTTMRVRVSNSSDQPLVVRGLSSRRAAAMDSLPLGPGETGTAEFTADAAGTFYYWASAPGQAMPAWLFENSQLYGAFIVDPPGADPARDRVFMIGIWVDGKLSNGEPDFSRAFAVINGRPWPHTERLEYQMGDSVRWRWINVSEAPHPMHLHGFYYRVEARGDLQRDTTYWTAEQRMVVTEKLEPGATMAMAWSPDRPGGWVFHCHLNWHVVSNPRMGEAALSAEEREHEILAGHPAHQPERHVETGMGGLMMGLYVHPPAGYRSSIQPREVHQLYVQADSAPGSEAMRFGYVLRQGAEPARDSVQLPGPTIVLRKDQPTSIWVHNRSPEPTQVHWHGLELDSPFDGVVGVGGMAGRPTPPIMPGDSFEVRVTPPRAGSFMYHTHVNDIRQMSRGLWGALVVLEPGAAWDPAKDHVFMIGESIEFEPILNGTARHDTVRLEAEASHRFRLMNIAMGGPNLEFWLVGKGAPVLWTPLAKDGHDLPGWQRRPARATQTVSIGETFDFDVTLERPGGYTLEVRRGNGSLLTGVPVQVQAKVPTAAQQIAAALLPLPAQMRDSAAVLGYSRAGELGELRQGSNGMICLADDPKIPAFHVACYHASMEPFMARGRALRKSGVADSLVDTVRYKEVGEGTLKMPEHPASLFSLSAPAGSWNPETNEVTAGRPLYVVYIPGATEASTGIPTTPQVGTPWLMFPGTPKAHIMFIPRM